MSATTFTPGPMPNIVRTPMAESWLRRRARRCFLLVTPFLHAV